MKPPQTSHIPSTGAALRWWLPATPVGAGLARAIEAAQAQDRCALALYMPVGFPDRLTGMDVLHVVAQSVDVIELGVPDAGGVLDGPVVQEASRAALAAGFRMKHLFDAASELSATSSTALLVTSPWRSLYDHGPAEFAAEAAAVGISAVMVPDLPLEEEAAWLETTAAVNLGTVPLVSPHTGPERLTSIAAAATAMLYTPATSGPTGNPQPISPRLPDRIAQLRTLTSLPVAAGIGISTPAQARTAATAADLVAVGSAVIRRMQASPRAQTAAAAAASREFAAALRPAPSPTETDEDNRQ